MSITDYTPAPIGALAYACPTVDTYGRLERLEGIVTGNRYGNTLYGLDHSGRSVTLSGTWIPVTVIAPANSQQARDKVRELYAATDNTHKRARLEQIAEGMGMSL